MYCNIMTRWNNK